MPHGSSVPKFYITLERLLQISSLVAALVFSPSGWSQTKVDPDRLSLEEKIGQLMIWTFGGTQFTATTEEMLRRYHVGSLIAFSRNIKSVGQIATFNQRAQNYARLKLKAPLFLMIDQEGGTVTRLKINTPLPSALALGRMHNSQYVENFGKTKGELLSLVGFNVNLSPVMDISDPTSNSFVSNRVFGNDPDEVTENVMAYARGLSSAGVIPTAKHFPGHGGMVSDSHLGSAKKLATIEELEQKDLVPFIEYADAKFPRALMMAHMALPNIDPSGLPATYSGLIIQDLLREKYGFKGLVLTDDLEMGGASITDDIGERAIKAFLAGNDMLMFAGHPKNQKKAHQAMVAAVRSGRISKERLNESVVRILETKASIKPLKYDLNKTLNAKTRLETFSREIMHKNFKDSAKTADSWPKAENVLVLSSDRSFYENFQGRFGSRASTFKLLTPRTMKHMTNIIGDEKFDLAIYYATGSQTANWVSDLPRELRTKVIVVNCNNPGKIENEDHFRAVLHLNSLSPESGGWLAEILNAPARPTNIRGLATEAAPLPAANP